MVNKFTQKARDAMSAALSIAEEMGHSYIGSEHLLLGLIAQEDSIASRILTLRGADESKLRERIAGECGVGVRVAVSSQDMTPALRTIIESGLGEAKKSRLGFVGTEHLLWAMLESRDCRALRLLEAEGVPSSILRTDLLAYLDNSPQQGLGRGKKESESPLLRYGIDLTAAAAHGGYDPVFCRDAEMERLMRILCRRVKNNPCILGEAGVGKTALVEGLALRIAEGDVPEELSGKRIISLELSSMIAGAKYRGEFEERIRALIEQAEQDSGVILFVDEMHIMVGAGGAEGAIDASGILKPALARGRIKLIGATTPDEYRKYIEKDPAFERRFQPLILREPTPLEAKQMIMGQKVRYEEHHGISISEEAVECAVRLSARYMKHRHLPDKALDVIDEASSKLRLSHRRQSDRVGKQDFLSRKEEALKAGDILAARRIKNEEITASAEQAAPSSPQESTAVLMPEHIMEMVSEHTGIPCRQLEKSDYARLQCLQSELEKRVIGQESAVRAVSEAVKRGRLGISSGGRPVGSFLFLGDTGVGKTELCRALADLLFDGRDAFIRFDMSEYMERHSVSKLIGAPPGYVGYSEGGLLTKRVAREPYSVVLFDEIEKAHPDIFNLLLQVLEDGCLSDSSGKRVDFSGTLIIMTSNLISGRESRGARLGFGENSVEQSDPRDDPRLTCLFRREFLNRIDELIFFSALDRSSLEQIARRLTSELAARVAESGVTLTLEQGVTQFLARECAERHKGLGARPMRREIIRRIEQPLAERMIAARGNSSRRFRVYMLDGDIAVDILPESV